jgi:hypothetical protein
MANDPARGLIADFSARRSGSASRQELRNPQEKIKPSGVLSSESFSRLNQRFTAALDVISRRRMSLMRVR